LIQSKKANARREGVSPRNTSLPAALFPDRHREIGVRDAKALGWQLIDTVPRDESVLVFTQRWGAIIAELSSEFGEWLSRMQCPVALKDDDEQPTHWMALPAPPDDAEAAKGGQPLAATAG
jgi:hypothetical protein